MKTKLLIASLLFWLAATGQVTQDTTSIKLPMWLLACSTNSGDNYFMYIEQNGYIKQVDGTIKVWIKLTKKKDVVKKKVYLNSTVKTLAIINYTEKTYRITQIIYYDSKGNLIESLDSDDFIMKDAVPESCMDIIIKSACKLSNSTSE